MKRTRLRNKFLKHRTGEDKRTYSKQLNYCVSLLRKTKKEYYSNLDERNVTDNRKFWKTVKPFLSDKIVSTQKIILVESDKIISNTAQILNTFLSNIVSNLKIPEYVENNPISGNIKDPILKLIVKYRNHPSILICLRLLTVSRTNFCLPSCILMVSVFLLCDLCAVT